MFYAPCNAIIPTVIVHLIAHVCHHNLYTRYIVKAICVYRNRNTLPRTYKLMKNNVVHETTSPESVTFSYPIKTLNSLTCAIKYASN